MVRSLTVGTIKYVTLDILFDLVKFPVWWYTAGVQRAGKFFIRQLKLGLRAVGLKVWLANLFRPMFGDYSWEGRLISFFVRLLQIIARTILMILWLCVVLTLFLLWLVLPPFVIYMIIRQII
ncbi:hypothetical protein KKD19_00545 [Patescibacteria group bacterium]|nr:hypothetical protein [Patescibacteria group bacterium]MBU4511721.1 hypothetical protein [Patescibacteria group bacterium]MCG2692840.1 hypothetical protein [Candidatus Parcubacteria bacterium]